MTEAKNKGGRPRKYDGTKKNPTLAFRVRNDLYEKLKVIAEAGGYSLSEVIERRLDASFTEPDILVKIEQIMRPPMAVPTMGLNKYGMPSKSDYQSQAFALMQGQAGQNQANAYQGGLTDVQHYNQIAAANQAASAPGTYASNITDAGVADDLYATVCTAFKKTAG